MSKLDRVYMLKRTRVPKLARTMPDPNKTLPAAVTAPGPYLEVQEVAQGAPRVIMDTARVP